MSSWDDYVADHTIDGRHKKYTEWRISGEWEFRRSDGLITAHKIETPYMTWREACEESMRLADLFVLLGATLLDGMRTRDDPDYGPLFDVEC